MMGPCAGGAVYSPAVTDFTVMVDQTSHMFITGPDVIKTVTGEDVGMEELGGARTHNTKSGNAHYLASDEEDAIEYVKALLSYLPSNNMDDPPRTPRPPISLCPDVDRELDTLVPDSANQPYDIHTVIEHVLDDGEFLEVHPLYAQNIVVGFGRVEGRPVGVVANQPMQLRRHAGHRRVGEGGPLRAHLRRVQRPGADLRRRPRLPARHRPGVGRHHPARRQAHLRVRRGDRPARSPSSPARRTAARTTSWAPSTSAPTSTSPGRPRRSPSWARRAR